MAKKGRQIGGPPQPASSVFTKIQGLIEKEALENFILVVAPLQLLLFTQVLILIHYFRLDPIASLSFVAEDTHCETNSGQGLGVHCFGDYSYLRNALVDGSPWDKPFSLSYTATGILPVVAGYAVEQIFHSFNAGLFFYVCALALSVSSPWLVFVVGNPQLSSAVKILGALSVGPLSLPALVTIDRGNTVGFLVPFLLMFMVGLKTRNSLIIGIGACSAALLKPQLLGLLLFLLLERRYRAFVIAGLVTIGATLLAYLTHGQSVFRNLALTISNSFAYGTSTPQNEMWPVNVSIGRGLELALESVLGDGVQFPPWISIAFASVSVCALLILRDRIPREEKGLILVLLCSLSIPVSWGYYLVFAIVTVLFIPGDLKSVETTTAANGSERPGRPLDRTKNLFIFLGHLMSMTTLLLPISTSNAGTLLSSHQFTSLFWLCVVFLSFASGIWHGISKRRVFGNESITERHVPLD